MLVQVAGTPDFAMPENGMEELTGSVGRWLNW